VDIEALAKTEVETKYRKLEKEYKITKKRVDEIDLLKIDSSTNIGALQTEIEELKRLLDEENKGKANNIKIKKQYEQQLLEANERTDEKERERARLERANQRLEQQLKLLREKEAESNTELEENSKEKDTKLEELKTKLQKETESRIRFEQTNRQLESQINELKQEMETDEKIKQPGGNTSQLKKQFQEQIDILREQLDLEVEAKEGIKAENRKFVKEKEQLEKAYQEVKEKLKLARAQLDKAKEDVVSSERSRSFLAQEKKQLQQDKEIFIKEVSDLMKSEGKLESVHKEGYLQKEGTDGIIKSNQWKKRWFILKNLTLQYFKSPSDKTPLGEIIIEEGAQIKKLTEKKFFITSKSKSVMLIADTMPEVEGWIKAIQNNMKAVKQYPAV